MDPGDKLPTPFRSRVGSRMKPRKIGEILTAYLRGEGLQELEQAKRLREAWRASVSEEVSKETRLLRVSNGVVHVGVFSSSLLFELDGYRQPRFSWNSARRILDTCVG